MKTLRIALLQLKPKGNDQKANRVIGEAAVRRARERGADIALFPEMWNVGYAEGFDRDREDWQEHWHGQAVAWEGAFVSHFRELARELEMAIGITYLEKWSPAPRNTLTLYDRKGQEVLTYSKLHLCDFFPMERSLTPGEAFPVTTLETAQGPVQVGAMICYDREFPESARTLMLGGAEIVLTPNACGLDERRLGQFQARAFENSMVMVMTNYAEGGSGCNGHSIAYDAEGYLLLEAGGAAGIYLVEVDLDKMRETRRESFWGDAFRRPHRYGALVEQAAQAAFAGRKDGFDQPWPRGQR